MPICARCQTAYPDGTRACPTDGTLLADGLVDAQMDLPPHASVALPPSDMETASDEVAGALAVENRRATDKTDPLLGSLLAGRFRLQRRLGEGGMGVVYQATHAVIGRPVAVKVLHERFVDRREVAARLMNEARLASAIHNQHIVDIFDFGETSDGRTFVVMELCEGCSLAQVIRGNGPLDETRAGTIALQVADALGAAHAAGVIHRDVKPENIFLLPRDGGEFVKVLDFGISKALRGFDPTGDGEEPLRLTHTGVVLGTPLYMSPEQARGDDNIDHRIDIYALGVILYETLTGEVPFTGTNYLSIISEVQHREVVRPREIRPELSAAIERVVLRAMHRERDQRYASMSELADDLRRALGGEGLAAEGSAAAPRAARSRARSWPIWWALGAGAMALLVATATVWLARSESPAGARGAPSRQVPTLRATGTTLPGATAAATSAPLPAPSVPPSSTVIVKIQSTPPGAAILNGSRRLGVTPQAVELARSPSAVHLRFELEGYEPSATDILPQIDGESVEIELKPVPPAPLERPHHSHHPSRARRLLAPPEMLPAANPYR